jgi:hypothetical protein
LAGSAWVALLACSGSSDSSPAQDTGTPTDGGGDTLVDPLGEGPAPTNVGLAPKCSGTLAADGSALHFSDTSSNWEIDAAHLDVVGNHIEAIDLDADGYPDLLVHMGNQARSDPTQPGNKQLVRVLMNRAKDGGGRHFVDATLASHYGDVRSTATPPAGLLRMAHLAVAADVDGDGDVDLFSGTYVDPTSTSADLGDRSEVLLNDGHGVFSLAPPSDVQKVPSDVKPPTTSAAFVDADHDGIVDLWVGFWYRAYGTAYTGVQARLFKGNGDGTFTDATKGSGLETTNAGYDADTNHRPAYGVTACDLDDDGKSELLVSAYGREWNLLYTNASTNGAFAFSEIGQASGYAGDSNIDYTDNQFYECYCKQSGVTCSPPPAGSPTIACTAGAWDPAVDPKPWRNNGNTFSTVCADLNGDGKRDLYSAEIAHWHIGQSSDKSELLVNDGPTDGAAIHFTRPGRDATGLAWPHPTSDWNEGGIMVAAADLDLDGLDDLIVGASDYPNNWSLVYLQKHDAPGTFQEVGKDIGLQHDCTVGLAVADFDRDGDLDVVVGSSTARDCATIYPHGNEVHLYENALNDGDAKRGFVQVQLKGLGAGHSNFTGLGARVKIVSGGVVQTKELQGGYGHFGMQHDTVLTFGLGGSCMVDELEVRWPDDASTRARYLSIGGGRRVLVQEAGGVSETTP